MRPLLDNLDPIETNVIIYDVDTGRILRTIHNAITTPHRQEYARFLAGQSVVVPRYVAMGARSPGASVTPTEFTQLLAETARSGVGSALLQGSTSATTRIAATIGAGVGANVIREAGLFSEAESAEVVDRCNVQTGWASDGGTVGIVTNGHVEGTAALQTTRDASTEVRSFYRSNLAVDASGLNAASARLQFWYYVDDAALLSTGHSIRLTIGGTLYTAPDILPATGAFTSGWNFFDIPLSSLGISSLSNNVTGFDLRVVKSDNAEITERLDGIRLWQPSGVLWAYTRISPELTKSPHQTIGLYWYLSIDIAAEPSAADSFAFEEVDVGSGVVQLDAAKYMPTGAAQATQAVIQNVSNNVVRYRTDGGDAPTNSSGHQLGAGDSILLRTYNEITRFRAIQGGGSSKLAVTYRR